MYECFNAFKEKNKTYVFGDLITSTEYKSISPNNKKWFFENTDLKKIKLHLWNESNRNLQTIITAASNINQAWPCDIADQFENVIAEVKRMKKKSKPVKQVTDFHDWKTRYRDVHKLNYQREYPCAWRDGHYHSLRSIDLPDVSSHGGLITFMLNMIRWCGGNASSHNVVARVSDQVVKEESGNSFTEKRYTKSSRKGIADVQGTIHGKRLQLDSKVGKDKPRKEQLEEQARERKAGGIYEFIHCTDEFFNLFDGLLYG